MQATKDRHLAYLQALEARYKHSGSPTQPEQEMLQQLLTDHDEQVKAFKAAMIELKSRDMSAHAALLNYISVLNSALSSFTPTAEH